MRRNGPRCQHIVGLAVLGAHRILDNEGELRVTNPELVKASADDLAQAWPLSRSHPGHIAAAIPASHAEALPPFKP
jgi:hypothetical protein